MKCMICQYEWEPRISVPKKCPCCQRWLVKPMLPARIKKNTKVVTVARTDIVKTPVVVANPVPIQVKPKMGYSEEMNADECIKKLSFVAQEQVPGLVAKLRMECDRVEVADYIILTAMENRKTLAEPAVAPGLEEKSDLAPTPVREGEQ